MMLSAPIHVLKSKAKQLSRSGNIPFSAALDQLARQEGFRNWTLLTKAYAQIRPVEKLQQAMKPGELVLLGARPHQGKTLLGLELIIEEIKAGNKAWFFSLDWTLNDIAQRLQQLDTYQEHYQTMLTCDVSDEISSSYVIDALGAAPEQAIVVIDYLQLLDQNRAHPTLNTQIGELKNFIQKKKLRMLILSQISRSFELTEQQLPSADDIRLPNPVDLGFFNKLCFLNAEKLKIQTLN